MRLAIIFAAVLIGGATDREILFYNFSTALGTFGTLSCVIAGLTDVIELFNKLRERY